MAEDQFTDKQVTCKAWVESGRLHVHADLQVENASLQYQLDRREQQGYFPDELFLEIKPDPSPGNDKVTVKYHEETDDKNKYKTITLFAKSEQVLQIKDIGDKAPA